MRETRDQREKVGKARGCERSQSQGKRVLLWRKEGTKVSNAGHRKGAKDWEGTPGSVTLARAPVRVGRGRAGAQPTAEGRDEPAQTFQKCSWEGKRGGHQVSLELSLEVGK